MLGDITTLLHGNGSDEDHVANTDVAAGAQPAGGDNKAQQVTVAQRLRLYNKESAVVEERPTRSGPAADRAPHE